METKELKNKIIAVVGVSRDEKKYGFKVFKDLIGKGLNVYGVNPQADFILGRKIYNRLSEIPEKIDLVITVVPPKVTEEIVGQCRQLGVKEIWMQPGSESERAVEMGKEFGIRVISNACIMVNS